MYEATRELHTHTRKCIIDLIVLTSHDNYYTSTFKMKRERGLLQAIRYSPPSIPDILYLTKQQDLVITSSAIPWQPQQPHLLTCLNPNHNACVSIRSTTNRTPMQHHSIPNQKVGQTKEGAEIVSFPTLPPLYHYSLQSVASCSSRGKITTLMM